MSFRNSFFHEILIRPWEGTKFVAFSNYFKLLSSGDFWSSFSRTIGWTVSSVIGKTVIGLIIALLLNKKFRGRGIYRTLILVPWVTPQVIGAIVWKWIYNGEYGMLNYVLIKLGFLEQGHSWLGNPDTAFLSCLIDDIWVGIPFMSIVFLAGLQAIPQEMYEAAQVDGAGKLKQLFFITLPQLKPVFLTATILSTIWTFNSFNIIWTLTRGGPVNATEILVVKTYKTAFQKFNIGLGSTYAVIIFIILMIFSITYWRRFNDEL
ncbi:binding-protein-dependent transport systems inner membrane component [Halothermothrix orenii H 168]|uniref:Binding-protein-dependent transport systems inner membrane component n=2 Tax=Halothermothrix orenii TaxID=31909 RepID=B8D086_HALOH|nr:binding-protein-dependent transport systems inner membrane component [Halothermothrix orenii H 168]